MNSHLLASDYLAVAKSYLPPTLPGVYEGLCRLAQKLPGHLSTGIGLEYRLGDDAAPIDLSLCAGAGLRNTAQALVDNMPTAFLTNPTWRRIQSFAKEWIRPDHEFNDKITSLWLEFDFAAAHEPIPTPSVFISSEAIKPGQDHGWFFDSALATLIGSPVDEHIRTSVVQCIDRLPPGAFMISLGLMLARELDSIRLVTRDIECYAVIPYLKSVGWPGEAELFEDMLAFARELKITMLPVLDVGQKIGAKLGLECWPDLADMQRYLKWSLILERLVQQGLCLPSMRDGVMGFLGLSLQQSEESRWPKAFVDADALFYGMYHSVIIRDISHIKITYESGKAPEAKIYLRLSHVWMTQQQLTQISQLQKHYERQNRGLS